MSSRVIRSFAVLATVMFLSMTVLELSAHARAGGGRSSGSRSYSRPASPTSQPSPSRQYSPAPSPMQQPAGGGFMRSMAGGMAGGMLGSMLFSGLAGAGGGMGGGMGSTGGGGIGLFEIILLAGGGYLLYRYIKARR